MPTNVLMPKTGADETHGKLVKWLKQEGDLVTRGDSVAEIETDKVNMDVEAFSDGRLYRILVHEGETEAIGKPIAILLKEGEQPPPEAAPPSPAAIPSASSSAPAVSAPAVPEPAATVRPDVLAGRIKASPLAKKIAESHHLDLSRIVGRGPGGRVVKDDVEAALAVATPSTPPVALVAKQPVTAATMVSRPEPEAAPAAADTGATHEVALTRMQLTAGRRLTESKQTAPHFYLTVEVDMAEAMVLRSSLNEQAEGSVRVSVNDLVLKAAAWALRQHPTLNAAFHEGKLQLHDHINLSVAIALDDGLVSPVIADVDRKSLGQVARESKALAERARAGSLRPEDYADGTFTVTNLGMFGIDTFVAIINPPQAAILAVGAVRDLPVVRKGEIVAGRMMTLTLSADHRATDGAQGARFLADVRRALERPLLMAL